MGLDEVQGTPGDLSCCPIGQGCALRLAGVGYWAIMLSTRLRFLASTSRQHGISRCFTAILSLACLTFCCAAWPCPTPTAAPPTSWP